MLKRSKLLVAFLVVTVLCAGIGFAAVSDTLNVAGSLSVNVDSDIVIDEFNADVYFTSVENTATGITATVDSVDDDKVNITIDDTVLTSVGSTAVIVANIKNAGEYTVTLNTPTTSNEDFANYATVTAELGNSTLTGGDSTTLTITVELTAIPAESFTDYAFSVTVIANPAQ